MKKVYLIVTLLFSCLSLAAADIILSDIVGGGDGTGTAPVENVGINPDTGAFSTEHAGRIWNTGDPLVEVADSEFVDSVFIIAAEEQEITLSGVPFFFTLEDFLVNPDDLMPGAAWDMINKDGNPGNPAALLVGTVEYITGIGIHSAAGVTFDLDALRTAHGNDAVQYASTVAGGDACGTLNVDLYMILSSETDVLEFETFHSLANQAAFMQMEITPEAKYLTLATTCSNGVDSCDHGTFAEARITAEPVDAGIKSVSVMNYPGLLAGGGQVQIQTLAVLNAYDALVTPSVEDVSYTSSDAGIIEVTPEGIMTAQQIGKASITISVAGTDIVKQTLVGIDLGGMAAGSNGFDAPDPTVVGINPDDGQWALARTNANITDANGINPNPVDNSSFINCVFLLNQDSMPITVTQEGLPGTVFNFPAGNMWANGWENILNGWEPGGPDHIDMGTAGIFYNGLGIHAAAGITYDLEEIRDEHEPDAVGHFYTIAGEGAGQTNANGQPINAYVIVSNDDEILGEWSVLGAVDRGEPLTGEIPEEAQYLTFAVGVGGANIGSAHGCFAQAVILSEAPDSALSEFTVTPGAATLRAGDEYQLAVNGVIGLTGVNVDLTEDSAYSSSDPATVSVSPTGLLMAEANGQATITVTYDGMETTMVVDVVDNPFSELVCAPNTIALAPDATLQLAVSGLRGFDNALVDITGDVTYESSDEGVIEVDDAGLVLGVGKGSAELTITFEDLTLTVPAIVIQIIDLGEIVGGGDGTPDNPPTYLGIDASNGFMSDNEGLNTVNPAGLNPEPVDTSFEFDYDLIDSVFLILEDTMAINTAGDVYSFQMGDAHTNTWDLIANTQESDFPPGSVDLGPLGVFYHGLGVHASAGITYDLEALRDHHGPEAIKFVSAYMGDGNGNAAGSVNCYIILTDGDDNTVADAWGGPYTNNGEFVELAIPDTASFLTLAVGDANNGIGADHGIFANAFITECSILDPSNCGGNGGDTVGVFTGNANGDTKVDLADAISLLTHLFVTKGLPCLKSADANDDNKLDLADAISILTYQFQNGSLIAPDGSTVTSATLGCHDYPVAEVEELTCENPCE